MMTYTLQDWLTRYYNMTRYFILRFGEVIYNRYNELKTACVAKNVKYLISYTRKTYREPDYLHDEGVYYLRNCDIIKYDYLEGYTNFVTGGDTLTIVSYHDPMVKCDNSPTEIPKIDIRLMNSPTCFDFYVYVSKLDEFEKNVYSSLEQAELLFDVL